MRKYVILALGIIGLVGVQNCGSDGSSDKVTVKGSATAPDGISGRIQASRSQAVTTTSPSSLKIKVYEVWFSTSKLCTDPILIFKDDAAEYKDLVQEPVLGSGGNDLEDGSYECLIAVFSDTLKYAPEEDVGTNCVAGEEYSGDTCHDGTTVTLPDGTSVDCADNQDDKIVGYLSTAVTEDLGGDSSNFPPDSETSPTKGGMLASPLVVDGPTTTTMYLDLTDRIRDNDDRCEMSSALVGFK